MTDPTQPHQSDDLRSIFGDLLYDKRFEAWNEGYLEAARDMDPQGASGVMPWQLAKNPYRSES